MNVFDLMQEVGWKEFLSLGYETPLGKSVTCGVMAVGWWRSLLSPPCSWLSLSALTAQQTRLANRDNKTFDTFWLRQEPKVSRCRLQITPSYCDIVQREREEWALEHSGGLKKGPKKRT